MFGTLGAAIAAHWHALMMALAVWIFVATFLARRWPKPAADAKWYVKLAHFALVDLPSLAATLNGKTWMGMTISIPFITWTVRDPNAQPVDVAKALIPFAIGFTFAVALSGCATSGTPANATLAQKLQADAAALQTIAKDVKTKCGPQFAPLAPLIASALAVAADPTNVVADIMTAVSMIPAVAQDVKGVTCVVTTIRDDFNALKPKPGTTAARVVMIADLALYEIGQGISIAAIYLPAAYAALTASTYLSPVCDPNNDASTRACREVDVDDGVPARATP